MPPVLRLRELLRQWKRPHTNIQGRTESGDSSGGEKISRSGLRSGESSGFRTDARVCKFQAADHSANARVVSSRGFGSAAGFCMFQLWVLERTTQPALTKA